MRAQVGTIISQDILGLSQATHSVLVLQSLGLSNTATGTSDQAHLVVSLVACDIAVVLHAVDARRLYTSCCVGMSSKRICSV